MNDPFDYIKNSGIDNRTSMFNNPSEGLPSPIPGITHGRPIFGEQGPGADTETQGPSGPQNLDWQPIPFDRWMSEQMDAAPIGPQGQDYWWELYLDYIASGGKQHITGE